MLNGFENTCNIMRMFSCDGSVPTTEYRNLTKESAKQLLQNILGNQPIKEEIPLLLRNPWTVIGRSGVQSKYNGCW